ncbi:MAG TPA: 30S ribosomal protein S20 [Gammaproteobacteria bacterium]|nr:30S ribosomal protein S20 [Gammaproteobacteria bacterium]
MANIASARKRARQAVKKRAHNMSLRSRMRTYVKRVRAAIDAGDKDAATAAYSDVVSSLDSSASKGIIHANNAARKKSRLNAQIKAL